MSHDHDDHDHDARPRRNALRVEALESLLVEKGLVEPARDRRDRPPLRAGHRSDERRPRGRARLGRSGVQARACSPTAPPRSPSSASAAPQGEHLVVVENTPARAQRRRVYALLLLPVAGARPAADLVQEPGLPLARRARAARRAARDGARAARRASRSASGTRAPRSATWCCPSGPPAPTGSTRTRSRAWVTRDAMIGVGAAARARASDG